MTMDPSTGEGFDAVLISESEYFDPDAQDPKVPGVMGLLYKKSTYWQGDVEFDTFDLVGPKYGPEWPAGSLKAGGLGVDAAVWGLSNKAPPGPGDPVFNNGLGVGNDPNAPRPNTATAPDTSLDGGGRRLIYTPCFEDDGSPTLADEARNTMDITLFGAYGGDIRFPVLPAEIGGAFTHEYWTPKVVGLGEVVLPGGDAMETIGWDSFFPGTYDSNYVTISPLDMEDPKSVTARIIWTMRFKMSCFLVLGGSGIWNEQVVITNFSYKHIAGEPHDIYYTIQFKRYRTPVVTTTANLDPNTAWIKDPRGTPSPLAQASQEPDPNPAAVDVVPDRPITSTAGPVTDTGFLQRAGLIVIISGGADGVVKHSMDPAVNHMPYTPDAALIAAGLPVPKHPPEGETAQEAATRLSQFGPNNLDNLLTLNAWIQDNGYSPYTTHLNEGEGLRYYRKQVPLATPPPSMVEPNKPNRPFVPPPSTGTPGASTPVPTGTPGPGGGTPAPSAAPRSSTTPLPAVAGTGTPTVTGTPGVPGGTPTETP